jgi:hypothetical protein
METLFPLLVSALEFFNWYGLQHVYYNRKNKCFDLIDRIANEQDFVSRVITGDESRIFKYDPETKSQSKERYTVSSPRPKKA